MAKDIIIKILIVVIILLIGSMPFIGWFTYKAGINSERAADAKAIMKYQNKMKGLISELEAEKAKKKIETRTKIVRIKDVQDNCADQPINPAILDQLR